MSNYKFVNNVSENKDSNFPQTVKELGRVGEYIQIFLNLAFHHFWKKKAH